MKKEVMNKLKLILNLVKKNNLFKLKMNRLNYKMKEQIKYMDKIQLTNK